MANEEVWQRLKQTQNIVEFRNCLGDNFFALKSQEPLDKDALSRITSLFCIISDIHPLNSDAESTLTPEMFDRLKVCLEVIARASPTLLITEGITIIDTFILNGDAASAARLEEFQKPKKSTQFPLDPPQSIG